MRFRCHPYRYPMQPVLPLIRSMTEPPFTFTGVDFSGPHQVREAAGVKKVAKVVTELGSNTAVNEQVCRGVDDKQHVREEA